MLSKNKISRQPKQLKPSKVLEQIGQHPDIKLVKKIASITERTERNRLPLTPQQTKFYKL